jgi:hypothetical protein
MTSCRGSSTLEERRKLERELAEAKKAARARRRPSVSGAGEIEEDRGREVLASRR